jgi:hypothetical protein
MFGLLKSVIHLTTDVVDVVATPVKMVVDLADAAVRPIAEVEKDLARDIESLKD